MKQSLNNRPMPLQTLSEQQNRNHFCFRGGGGYGAGLTSCPTFPAYLSRLNSPSLRPFFKNYQHGLQPLQYLPFTFIEIHNSLSECALCLFYWPMVRDVLSYNI